MKGFPHTLYLAHFACFSCFAIFAHFAITSSHKLKKGSQSVRILKSEERFLLKFNFSRSPSIGEENQSVIVSCISNRSLLCISDTAWGGQEENHVTNAFLPQKIPVPNKKQRAVTTPMWQDARICQMEVRNIKVSAAKAGLAPIVTICLLAWSEMQQK